MIFLAVWPWNLTDDLENNRAPVLSNIKLYASFHHHLWIQTGVTVRKQLSWVLTSVTLTFDLWPWLFAWTSLLSMVITENVMMIWWQEHSEKVWRKDRWTDGRTDRRTDRGTGPFIELLGTAKNFKSDLRPIYDHAEWHTRPSSDLRLTCKNLRPKEDPAVSWITHKWNWQVPRPFLMVESGRGACRFQWRVSPSYCECLGVTYDLLVSNIGGTYDLPDQLPSNYEFGHLLVVSQSQVPREFSVNLALANIRCSGCSPLGENDCETGLFLIHTIYASVN